MNEAIKLAIEKGGYAYMDTPEPTDHEFVYELLDHLFWQALGKALGWRWKAYIQGQWNTEERDFSYMSDTPFREPEWLWQAKRYYELVLTGGDTEKFWKELIN